MRTSPCTPVGIHRAHHFFGSEALLCEFQKRQSIRRNQIRRDHPEAARNRD